MSQNQDTNGGTNVPPIPKQQTFDEVVAHLRKQGRQAKSGLGKCVYLARNGDKCAAGCLIRDGDYRPEFEDKAVLACPTQFVPQTNVGEVIASYGHDVKLVSRLQGIHDGISPENWERHFDDIAILEKLRYEPPINKMS